MTQAELPWALDARQAHLSHTRALPLYTSGEADGLFRLQANGLEFRARLWGMSNSGTPLLLLHGFPASSIMWEHLAVAAARSGHRVLAIDQRGYSPGARPQGRAHYTVDHFVVDALEAARAVGFDRFHLVGHDIGCVVSWVLASLHPERLLSLSGLSVSHPLTLEDTFLHHPPEYLQLFSQPTPIAESMLRADASARLRTQYAFMSPAELEEYHQLFMEPGSLTATLNFYRSIADSLRLLSDVIRRPITTPTTFLYGRGEQWVTPQTLATQETLVHAPYTCVALEGAGPTGHFVVEARREEVTRHVLEHVNAR